MCIGSTSARLAPIFILSLWIPWMSSFLKFKGKNLQEKYFLPPYHFAVAVSLLSCVHVNVSRTEALTCWPTCSCSCFSSFGTAHRPKTRKWSHCCGWHVSFCNTSTQTGHLHPVTLSCTTLTLEIEKSMLSSKVIITANYLCSVIEGNRTWLSSWTQELLELPWRTKPK